MPSETPARPSSGADPSSRGAPPPLHDVTLTINGEERRVSIEPRQVLLDVLRDELGLSGTKSVCKMGNCGACTVHLDGRAVYSCLVLGVECEGREIRTIEGLADGETLHPVQRAFVDCDAYQCGFCTPGQIMSLAALVDGDDAVDDAAVLRATSGNLCRCGAYRNILEAGRRAAGNDTAKNGANAGESAHGTR